MTGSQRRVHLRVWMALGPLLILGLILSIANRRTVPLQDPPIQSVGDETNRGRP